MWSLILKRIKNNIFFILFLLLSCDFSSRLHQDVVEVQNLIEEKQIDLAIAKYQEILNKGPNSELKKKILFQLGELYLFYKNNPKKSKESFEKILNLTNDPLWHVKVTEKIGEINFSYLKNFNESISIYKKLVSYIPKLEKYDYYEYQLALSFFNNNNFKKAKELLKKITTQKNHGYHIKSFYFLGMVYFFNSEWEKSIQLMKQYVARESKLESVVDAKYIIANSFEMQEKLKEAYNVYYSILNSYPNIEVIQERLKSIYARRVARKR